MAIQAPDAWQSLDEPFWKKEFDRWGQRTNTNVGDLVTFVDAVERFRSHPVMGFANLELVVPFIGTPEYDWTHGCAYEFPRDIAVTMTQNLRTNIEEGEEYEQLAQAEIPVPLDAFDIGLEFAGREIQAAWPRFFQDWLDSYDASSVNQAALKGIEDGEMINFVQNGDLLLIGGEHEPHILEMVRTAPTSLGSIQIEKGGFLSTGKLKVWGCVAADQGAFKTAVGEFSQKGVSFASDR